ncbi:MAG TPA: DUF3775 domain-containing protein [Alphaproteobacteria bacterium]|nr:DUF3775 domain-containing protein [Alphaproteobacteria bacterium]
MPELQIDTNKVCYLIVKGREFEALVEPEGDYDGSDAPDDRYMAVLERGDDNPVAEELQSFIRDLNQDELTDILTLLMIGRGDFGLEEWDDARREAGGLREERRPANLLAVPALPDYLEDALSQLDISCEDFEMGHL